MEKVKLQEGETVLIQAAGCGIGSAALQVAKTVGAKITTVGEDSKIAEARKLGADEGKLKSIVGKTLRWIKPGKPSNA